MKTDRGLGWNTRDRSKTKKSKQTNSATYFQHHSPSELSHQLLNCLRNPS